MICDRSIQVSPPQTSSIAAGSTICRAKATMFCRGPAGRGRNRQAAASISGYSTAPENINGAAKAFNRPPRTPPSDIHK